MTTARWEHFRHGADIGVRGLGPTQAQAFEQAALALSAVVTDPGRIAPAVAVDVACAAPDAELLLVDFLNELVYLMATRRMLCSRFEVRLDGGGPGHRLAARAWGEPVDVGRHEPAVEVKGATLTALRVAQQPDGTWLAQCVVDV
ncbi:MAG TPA: archease [Planctomycetota bacterium]|nr:archease [Planctomycetota bacterium]